jgi:hypothetical protein
MGAQAYTNSSLLLAASNILRGLARLAWRVVVLRLEALRVKVKRTVVLGWGARSP